MLRYARHCNKTGKDLRCDCSHTIEQGEYYTIEKSESYTKVADKILCNKCYDEWQKYEYKKQTEKMNKLHVRCPFCREFISISFNYHGGNTYGGQDSGIVCSECGRDFFIELDVRQGVSALNE